MCRFGAPYLPIPLEGPQPVLDRVENEKRACMAALKARKNASPGGCESAGYKPQCSELALETNPALRDSTYTAKDRRLIHTRVPATSMRTVMTIIPQVETAGIGG